MIAGEMLIVLLLANALPIQLVNWVFHIMFAAGSEDVEKIGFPQRFCYLHCFQLQ
jgi:hypothetical protein